MSLNFTFIRSPQPFHAISLECHSGQFDKSLGNVEIHQWRDFEKTHSVSFRVGFSLSLIYLPLESQMQSIANENFRDARGMLKKDVKLVLEKPQEI